MAAVAKSSTAWRNAAFDDVVAQNHADLLAVSKVLGQGQGFGNAAFAFLVGVINVLQTELLAICQEAEEIAGIPAAGNN